MKYVEVLSPADFPILEAGKPVAVDLETTNLDPRLGRILIFGFAQDPELVYLVHGKGLEACREQLVALCRSDALPKIYHNAKFDLKWLMHHVTPHYQVYHCTRVLRGLATNGTGASTSLAETVTELLGITLDKSVRDQFIGYDGPCSDEQLAYAAQDVSTTLQIFPLLMTQVESLAQTELYEEIERPLVDVVMRMEYEGIELDLERALSMQGQLAEDVARLDKELQEAAKPFIEKKTELIKRGDPLWGKAKYKRYTPHFNINSHVQVKKVLGAALGTELKSSSAEVLENLPHPLAAQILELRRTQKLQSSFVQPMLVEHLHPVTQRIHAEFNQLGATTGRFTCKNPNMQQLPNPERDNIEMAKKLRTIFKPREGFEFVVFDYSACELRVLAEYCQDERLQASLTWVNPKNGKLDPHTYNAAVAFDVPFEDVTSTQRADVKTALYAKLYGGGAATIAARTSMTVEQARAFVTLLDQRFPGMASWMKARAAFAEKHRYAVTMSGRRRYFVPSDFQHGGVKRKGQNTPIQGTNADITKLAMVYTARALRELNERVGKPISHLLLSVHDELVVEVHKAFGAEVYDIVKSAMLRAEAVFLRTTPCEVTGHRGETWAH